MLTTFSINGKPYQVELSNLPADITLNTFIREHAQLTGTKFMCQEGGCGVCVCVVTGKHPATGELRTWAVNSCLTLLNSCADWEITTSEGLGNKHLGYHSIQQRLAKLNGTQCGFCSPGFVMNMYGLLAEKQGKVTMAEVENAFGGNICRCTGYRPILDAMKSFATDSNIDVPAECRDIEDLTNKLCPKTGNACSGVCNGRIKRLPVTFADGSQWLWPKSLSELFADLAQLDASKNYMLVAGNTALGVYRRALGEVQVFIDVNGVPELSQHSLTANELTLGGNMSLSAAMEVFLEAAKQPGFEYCEQLWHHFDLIANVPVRNMGTLAGNISIKHAHKDFPSDVYIAFEALNAKLIIQENAKTGKNVTIAEYLSTPMKKKIIKAFVLPAYPRNQYIFESYKVMPRAQNSHAYVNAAFLVKVERPSNKVISASICFGGINPNYTHAKPIEDALKGHQLGDPAVAAQIFASAKQHLQADAIMPDASPEYRQKLACGLLYKFLLKHSPSNAMPEKLRSGAELLKRPVSSGKQTFERVNGEAPVHQPTMKYEGLIQVSGEALYANDVPVQSNHLWAAFVTAKKIGATVTNVDTSAAFKLPGVVAYFSTEDIPGVNMITDADPFFFPEVEPLFATGPIKYYDAPVGVIVAESNATANQAAQLVKLTYEGGAAEVFPTMQDVLNSASSDRIKHNTKSLIEQLKVPDTYDVHGSGKLELGHQYHFFMEPHSTVVVPSEGGFDVYAATQWMDLMQSVIASLLNVKCSEVQVKVRRIGGGYGGKATRGNPAACAAALAAFKLNRPVRFVQSIESMMGSLGKRWPFQSEYDFYVQKTGKILALRNAFYEDAGYLSNESPMGHTLLLGKNCYQFSDNYKIDGYMVITDSPSNTPCRAPGSVEGIAMIENILEHIAFATGVDPIDARKANLIPGHKMEQMLPHFVKSTDYKARKAEVQSFNAQNRWRKRGLGVGIMEYHIGYFGLFNATVAVYHGDGTVIISHGGIEMGQGMNTKVAQLAAHMLGIPLEMIRFEASGTVNGANGMVTGGSIGSEAICYAVRQCCNTLNERLQAVRAELKSSSWLEVVQLAHSRYINLIANDGCNPSDMEPYTVCALGLTEVEVDILTGNYNISRVDILEDAGESLNPNVDIGQVEGAFMMGMGYWTSEQIVVDGKSGEVKTNRTWNYKPPGAKDIPIDFRIELLPGSPNAAGFLRSKATGEPAICLGITVAFALQEALQSARADAGLSKTWITLTTPMSPERVLLQSGTDLNMLQMQ